VLDVGVAAETSVGDMTDHVMSEDFSRHIVVVLMLLLLLLLPLLLLLLLVLLLLVLLLLLLLLVSLRLVTVAESEKAFEASF
jgi:hypothetical protein